MVKFSKALITGATGGLGNALCRLLANEGIDLLITARNADLLEEVANTLRKSVTVNTLAIDLTDTNQRQILIDGISEHIPDLIINNAGYGLYGPAIDHEPDLQVNMVELNATAPTWISLESARCLLNAQRPGTIINISSTSSYFPFPNFAVYGATKAFVNSFSEALDAELSSKGIRVLTSCPGPIDTPFVDKAASGRLKRTFNSLQMTPEYAADRIWWQIQKGKRIHYFDKKMHVMCFCARYFLPATIRDKILAKTIAKRIAS